MVGNPNSVRRKICAQFKVVNNLKMASLNTNIGRDSIGLNEFAKRVERLCRYSDVSILLYRNQDGLFLSEIASSLGVKLDDVIDALDVLVRDDMVDEDRVRQYYMLGDTGNDIFDLNSNDSTITLESRLSEISNKLQRYAIAQDNRDNEMKGKIGDEITNYLYRTYSNTTKELKQLKNKVESEYKLQRDLKYKSQMLGLYIRQIEEIMYALDVSRPPEQDEEGNKKTYRNLKQMLYNDTCYGKDYRLSIDGFFKNCDAKLSNQILELYELFRTWWSKTKVALEDFRCAAKALEALIQYNPKNSILREAVENNSQPLPPIHRRLGRNEDSDEDSAYIDIHEHILSLDSVNSDEYNTITACCASLHYDFVNFSTIEDQAAPAAIFEESQPVEEIFIIDKEEEIKQFRSFDGTLLQFLRGRYPDLDNGNLLRVYMEIALETGEKPIVFNPQYKAEFVGEQFDEEYNIISIRNNQESDHE